MTVQHDQLIGLKVNAKLSSTFLALPVAKKDVVRVTGIDTVESLTILSKNHWSLFLQYLVRGIDFEELFRTELPHCILLSLLLFSLRFPNTFLTSRELSNL
jgi:hypothetical protein